MTEAEFKRRTKELHKEVGEIVAMTVSSIKKIESQQFKIKNLKPR